MSIAMKDKSFAKKCRTLFEKGSEWMDENLFNGEYYEHKIIAIDIFSAAFKAPIYQKPI